MKKLFLLLSLFFLLTSFDEIPKCSKLRIGRFKTFSETTGTTIITRTKTKQVEANDKYGSTQYDVLWIGNCTYELRNGKVLSGDKRFQGKKTDVIKVEIIKVTGSTYTARSSSNFHEGVLESEVQILH